MNAKKVGERFGKKELIDFVNLHGLINGEDGIADGRIGRGGSVMSGGGKVTAGAFNGVGIAVALGAGHGQGIGGDEFIESGALAIEGDVRTLGLGNLQKVAANSSQADGLGGGGAFIGDGHLFDGIKIDATGNGSNNEKTGKSTHKKSLAPRSGSFKSCRKRVALGNNMYRSAEIPDGFC